MVYPPAQQQVPHTPAPPHEPQYAPYPHTQPQMPYAPMPKTQGSGNKKAVIGVAAALMVVVVVVAAVLLIPRIGGGGARGIAREFVGRWEEVDGHHELVFNDDGTGRGEWPIWGGTERFTWDVVDGFLILSLRDVGDMEFGHIFQISDRRLTLTPGMLFNRTGGRGTGLIGSWYLRGMELQLHADGTGVVYNDNGGGGGEWLEWSTRNGVLTIDQGSTFEYHISGQSLFLIPEYYRTIELRRVGGSGAR